MIVVARDRLLSMKNERARALPSFSHGPHSKQEDVSRILQILASSF